MFREGKKCVIYIRVSTENQVDGFSLDAQRNTLKKFAEREGMILKEIYEDADNGWTIYTEDGSLSAQWEVHLVVTEDGYEILSY